MNKYLNTDRNIVLYLIIPISEANMITIISIYVDKIWGKKREVGKKGEFMSEKFQTDYINNFRVRNFTNESLENENLHTLVSFLASLDVCKSCLASIPMLESSFNSELNYQIDFETKTLDIRYAKNIVKNAG